jgi:fructokinase
MNPVPAVVMTSNQPKSVLILGEALADLFPEGAVLGGAPFNVARHLGGFGLATHLLSRVGQDAVGQDILHECRRFGVATTAIQTDSDLPSGHVHVRMTATGHRFEIAPNQCWDRIEMKTAVAAARAIAPAWLHLSTLAQRHPISRDALRAVLRACSAPVLLDLNLRGIANERDIALVSLTAAHVLKLNQNELAQVIEWFLPGADARAQDAPTVLRTLAVRFNLQAVIVTREAQGYWALDRSTDQFLAGPSPTVAVVDTVGAGDAFASVVLLGLIQAWPLPLSLQRAAEYAAGVCTLRGAMPTTPAFQRQFLQRWSQATMQVPA